MRGGGQSLNLTCANRVLLIDAWWNTAAEQQAFGRAFRFGQMKQSHFVRLFVLSTIDERIHQLQTSKSKEIDRALLDDGYVPTELNDIRLKKLWPTEEFEERENMQEIAERLAGDERRQDAADEPSGA